MQQKILVVASAQWRTALLAATMDGEGSPIEFQTAADAVISLASRPTAYLALALEAAAGGDWLPTLRDLTLGDTDRPVPLLMLSGADAAGAVDDTPALQSPVSPASLSTALATATFAAMGVEPPAVFSHVDAIRIRYQPIVRLHDLRPVTLEVLVRMATANGRLVGPAAVIDAMINGEHAMMLTKFIVERALAERLECRFVDLGLNLAFNLPLDAMFHPELLPIMESIRQGAGLPAKALRLELTETKPVRDLDAAGAVITRLRETGYPVALDDITPETHNLETLLTLPFSAVKLDRGVVIGAQSPSRATATKHRDFIAKIAAQSKLTGRSVIAEGIENQTTLNLMRSLGATHGQGYLFARPLPAPALMPWMSNWNDGAER